MTQPHDAVRLCAVFSAAWLAPACCLCRLAGALRLSEQLAVLPAAQEVPAASRQLAWIDGQTSPFTTRECSTRQEPVSWRLMTCLSVWARSLAGALQRGHLWVGAWNDFQAGHAF